MAQPAANEAPIHCKARQQDQGQIIRRQAGGTLEIVRGARSLPDDFRRMAEGFG